MCTYTFASPSPFKLTPIFLHHLILPSPDPCSILSSALPTHSLPPSVQIYKLLQKTLGLHTAMRMKLGVKICSNIDDVLLLTTVCIHCSHLCIGSFYASIYVRCRLIIMSLFCRHEASCKFFTHDEQLILHYLPNLRERHPDSSCVQIGAHVLFLHATQAPRTS